MEVGKKNKIVPIFFVLIVIILCGLAFYFLKIDTPKYVFDYAVDKVLLNEQQEFDTISVNTNVNATIESDDLSEEDEIVDFINNTTISMQTQLDKTQKEGIASLKIDSDNENLIDATAKLKEDSSKAYINLKNLFSKTIEVDTAEISEYIDEFFDSNTNELFNENSRKILTKEIKSQFTNKYFSKENVVLNDEKVTKNTLRIQDMEFYSVIYTICDNLSKNEEFLNCFEDREKMQENLNTIMESISGISESDTENITYIIDIYTKGITKQLKEIDINVKSSDEILTSLKLINISDSEYTYQILSGEEPLYTGNISYNQNNIKLSVESETLLGKITVNLDSSVEYNVELNKLNTSNSVKYSELTEDEYSEILNNLEKNKLYKTLIEPLLGFNTLSGTNTSDFDGTIDSELFVSMNNKEISYEIPDNYEVSSYKVSMVSEENVEYTKQSDDGEVVVTIRALDKTQNEYLTELQEKVNEYLNE